MDPLKLTALDAEDLEVVSAHMQDAVIRVGDMKYLPRDRRFVIVANRFDWQHADGARGPFRRRRTGLHFNRIESVKAQNIRQSDGDRVVSLLSVTFEPDEEPAGTIDLTFAGGGLIRLQVECVEAQMEDLGAVWETDSKPAHADAEQD